MKRTGRVLSGGRMKIQNPKAARRQRQPASRGKRSGNRDLLLRHPNFEAKSPDARREPSSLVCEAST
ncbi:hypothetical protein ACFLX4_00375 [Chloroflexota bacterium]